MRIQINRISQVNDFNKYINKIRDFLSDLVYDYPLHNVWFEGVVKELLENNRNSREILFALTPDDEIAGVSILKKTSIEKKICTLRVSEKYQNIGIGSQLMISSFEFLETKKPIITVSQSKLKNFKYILLKFDFELKKVYYGKYKELSAEYCYNGYLLPESILKKEKYMDIHNSNNNIA